MILAVALFASCMVVVLQNTEPVSTRILFYTITMPRAVLLFGTTCIGFTLGIILSFFMQRNKGEDTSADKRPKMKDSPKDNL